MLQQMLEEQRKKEIEDEENNKETEPEAVDDVEDEQKQKAPTSMRELLRRCSRIDWCEDESQDLQEDQLQTNIRSLALSDFPNPNSANIRKPGLDRSNFEWGAAFEDDDDIQEANRNADASGPLSLDTMLSEARKNETESGHNDHPQFNLFGWGRDKRDSKMSTASNDAPIPLLSPLFGKRNPKKQEGDDAASAVTEATAGSRNRKPSWQSIFRRDRDREDAIKEGDGERSQSNSIETSSADEELSDAIATMQVKLRGCDSAAASLQQLLSYQKRQITDLKHEKNRLKIAADFEALKAKSEMESLRTEAGIVKLEREQKISLQKEAEKCKSKLIETEEKLKEEIECVRMELFMLNMQYQNNSSHDQLEGAN